MQSMNIGQAAAAADVTPKMIRHYESLGLIPPADRTDAGYRLYGQREVAMLRFIRQSRALGFSIQQIGQLMSFWHDAGRQSARVKQVAQRQLQELEQRQRELDQMRATLADMVGRCRGDEHAHCVILETLAAPAPAGAGDTALRKRRALKEVRAGQKRAAAARPARRPPATSAPAHHALSAWTHGLFRPATA